MSSEEQTDSDSVTESPVQVASPPAPRTTEPGAVAAQAALSAFLILIAGFFALLPVLDTPFHGEDLALMIENDALHRLVTVPQAHDRLPYAPLTLYTLAANWVIAPHNAAFLHVINLLLHLANSVMLFLLCRKLLSGKAPEAVSMLAGLLFAAHPIVLESVQTLHARPSLLALFFVLLGSLCYLRAARNNPIEAIWLSAVMLCQAAAFASYAPALVMPLILLAIDRVQGRSGNRRAVHGIFLGTAAALAAAQWAAGLPWALAGNAGTPSVFGVGALLFSALPQALGGQALPYVHASADIFTGLHVVMGGAVFLLLLALTAFSLVRRSATAVALAWPLAAITFTALILPAPHVSLDQALYFPVAGLSLLIPWLFSRLQSIQLRAALGCAMAALVMLSGVITHQRAAAERDPVSFWARLAEENPSDPAPCMHLGRYLLTLLPSVPDDERDIVLNAAVDAFREALARAPEEVEATIRLGIALSQAGRDDEALPVLRDALRKTPLNQDISLRIAAIYARKSQENPDPELLRIAAEHIRRALRLGPVSGELAGPFGMTLAGLGDFETAIPLLQQAAGGDEASPWTPAATQLHAMLEQTYALERAMEEKLKQSPGDINAIVMQAEAQVMRGHWLSAAYILDAVLRKSPENGQAWMLLGVGRARMDAAASFLAEWREAPAANAEAWHDLALRCAGSGLWDAALEYLKAAPARVSDPASAAMRLADIAMELKQPQRAALYLELAAKERPEDPEPWLRLCDMAIAAKQLERARQYLAEAETRHAFPTALEERRKQAGEAPEAPGQPVRTIIR